jgi:hypothetical protein
MPAEMKHLWKRIEQWRQMRRRRTAMPAELWSEAVTLARSAGSYRVARALRLNFEALKRRMVEGALDGAPAVAPPSGFVELTRAQMVGAPTTGTVVEIEDESGLRVVVRLAKEAHVDVMQLISALRPRGT